MLCLSYRNATFEVAGIRAGRLECLICHSISYFNSNATHSTPDSDEYDTKYETSNSIVSCFLSLDASAAC